MDYGKAKQIRKAGLSNIIAARLVAGQGIGESLKSSISDVTKARATGIKEKFDILNIAKFMTGGSSIGPALVGSILGRSKEDIKNFAEIRPSKSDIIKKLKLIEAEPSTAQKVSTPSTSTGNKTATKITPEKGDEVEYQNKNWRWLGGQWAEVNPKTGKEGKLATKDISPILFNLWANPDNRVKKKEKRKYAQTRVTKGAIQSLEKIYAHLKKSYERRAQEQELEKDFAKERKVEAERRHKELLEALMSISFSGSTVSPVSNDIGLPLGLLDTLRKGASWLTTALLSPVGLAAALGATGFFALRYFQDKEDKNLREAGGEEAQQLGQQRRNEEYIGALDPSSEGAAIMDAAEGKETTTDKIKKSIEKFQRVREILMDQNGYIVSGKNKDNLLFKHEKTGEPPPPKLLEEVNKQAEIIVKQKKDITSGTRKDVANELERIKSINVAISQATTPEAKAKLEKMQSEKFQKLKELQQPLSVDEPVNTEIKPISELPKDKNLGTIAKDLTKENAALNLESDMTAKPPLIIENNNIVDQKGKGMNRLSSGDMAVRPEEDSLNWSILHAVRAV